MRDEVRCRWGADGSTSAPFPGGSNVLPPICLWGGEKGIRMRTVAPALRELGAGGKAALPLALGLVPFMTIYGVLMQRGGYAPLIGQAMTLLVFAGSQFVAAQLLLARAPGAVIIATCTMMNLRYALYSASIAPMLRQLSLPWRL